MASKQAGIILEHIRKLVAAQRRDELPDRQLLQQFAGQRDQAAFTALVQRHGPMVLRVCQRVLHNWHDAEDAFQATFLTLARKADSIRKQESVGSWLHGVAYRLSLQANADLRRHARLPESPDRPTVDPADEVTWRELRAMLDEELNRLPEKYRAPLLLCYLEGQTRDEAAQQLGCPLATLKSRLERGRELLRSRLSHRGLTLSAALLATGLSESVSPAMLPASLVHSTVQAALLFAAGNAVAAGVSAPVAALTKGVLKAMLLTKLKHTAALLLALGLAVAGAGVPAYHALAARDNVFEQASSSPAGTADGPRTAERTTDNDRQRPQRDERPREFTIMTGSDKNEMIVGSGKPATKEFKVADFTAVDVRQAIQVEITRADKFTAAVSADDNVLPYIHVVTDGATLKGSLEEGKNYRVRTPLKLTITMPALEAVTLGGAARFMVKGFKSKDFRANLRGATTLEGAVEAGKIDLDAAGASKVALKGSAKEAQLSARGASQLVLGDFPLAAASIKLRGGSAATVNVDSGKAFRADLEEAATLKGTVRAAKVELTAGGASRVSLKGSAKGAKLVANHASQFQLADFALDSADVALQGASSATVNAKDELAYALRSASHLTYRGKPSIRKSETSGASSASRE